MYFDEPTPVVIVVNNLDDGSDLAECIERARRRDAREEEEVEERASRGATPRAADAADDEDGDRAPPRKTTNQLPPPFEYIRETPMPEEAVDATCGGCSCRCASVQKQDR